MAVELLPMGVSITYRNRRRVRNGVPETYQKKLYQALTRLGQRGATLEELKKFAGHRDSSTVQRYQHATKARLASLVADGAAKK